MPSNFCVVTVGVGYYYHIPQRVVRFQLWGIVRTVPAISTANNIVVCCNWVALSIKRSYNDCKVTPSCTNILMNRLLLNLQSQCVVMVSQCNCVKLHNSTDVFRVYLCRPFQHSFPYGAGYAHQTLISRAKLREASERPTLIPRKRPILLGNAAMVTL